MSSILKALKRLDAERPRDENAPGLDRGLLELDRAAPEEILRSEGRGRWVSLGIMLLVLGGAAWWGLSAPGGEAETQLAGTARPAGELAAPGPVAAPRSPSVPPVAPGSPSVPPVAASPSIPPVAASAPTQEPGAAAVVTAPSRRAAVERVTGTRPNPPVAEQAPVPELASEPRARIASEARAELAKPRAEIASERTDAPSAATPRGRETVEPAKRPPAQTAALPTSEPQAQPRKAVPEPAPPVLAAREPTPEPVALAPAEPVAPAPAPAWEPPKQEPPAPEPERAAPAPAPKRVVAMVPRTPEVHVQRTVWHPTPQRRVATVSMEGLDGPIELHEGDAVGVMVVVEIQPSGVIFLHGTERLRRGVGGH